ncbi:hypothetical protein SGCZBJ_09850 [Caulobacter zeae]|uniref:Uncharacterized protein n=1 Tax=Caulobacter zeae TaxID=2055137 RepID=A0A2N5DKZ5_9CAUL|nr:restriction endonuclease [Caulobacter zeae]PLR26739.1 hypothetical protein SGCZBJ_09850 [Caulobacter zeae]
MRISRYFKLGRTQPTLDFVDVSYSTDTALFISPKALASLPSAWGAECAHLVQDFFTTVLRHIRAGRHGDAERLLRALREPNETHLGLSRGESRGRALGDGSAHDVWSALSGSKAARSGLIKDLEDTVLLIEGIGVDIISDMTTNIIRGPLLEYTNEMAKQYGIPLKEGVPSGPIWNSQTKEWTEKFTTLPMTPRGKILLVPKAVVRRHLAYSLEEYYRFYVLTHLQKVELDANSSLVQVVKKTKVRKVTKKSVEEKYGKTKSDVVNITIDNPDVFEKYKKDMDERPYLSLDHDLIAAVEGTPKPDWDALLSAVRSLPTGRERAGDYEDAVEALLSALFYPDLTSPRPQFKIHEGRKIVDVVYTNAAKGGFFDWLSKHYSSAMVWIECKNYGGKVANPELDQLSSRFNPSAGQTGILVCRSFDNKDLFRKRCRDTAKDMRGFIIALDDDDLATLVEARKSEESYQNWPLLKSAFLDLIV